MRKFLILATVAALAGCGGGGGGSSPAPTNAQPTTPPTSSQKQTANFVISFPVGKKGASAKRSPKYVSPGTTQVVIFVNSVNSNPPPSWVATPTTVQLTYPPTPSNNCTVTGGTATCTIPAPAPPGTVNYTVDAEDGSSNILSTLTKDIVIVQGTNNTPSVTLQGVVKTVTVAGAAVTANTAVSSGETLTVTADDASGNQIVDGTTAAPYNNPITLTDNDATGQTALTVNGGASSSSVTVNAPADVVKLTYTGQAANTFTLSASGTGITGGGTITTNVFDITFTGTTDDTTANGGLNTDPNWSEQTVFFAQASGSQNVTGAEVGFTNAPYSQQFDLDPGNGTGGTCGTGGGIATFSSSPATTFTVTATGVGICSVRLKEHGTGYPITQHPAPSSATDETHDGTFWVSVTSATFTGNSKGRHPH